MRSYDYEDLYEEYDNYGTGGYQKSYKTGPSAQKKEYHSEKKHQTKSKPKQQWEELNQSGTSTKNNFNSKPKFYKKEEGELKEIKDRVKKNYSSTPNQNSSGERVFTPGPNIHTIKNNIIDFDRVVSIEKVEGEYNGKMTYGIKFIFTGKKGSFRVAWFNKNVKERDSVYDTEVAFWQSLKN